MNELACVLLAPLKLATTKNSKIFFSHSQFDSNIVLNVHTSCIHILLAFSSVEFSAMFFFLLGAWNWNYNRHNSKVAHFELYLRFGHELRENQSTNMKWKQRKINSISLKLKNSFEKKVHDPFVNEMPFSHIPPQKKSFIH